MIIAANWQQLSADYQAYSHQVYNSAIDRLETALKNTPKGKQPVIITDIDDTLISNTSYFSSLIGTDEHRNIERSIRYWQNQIPKALPGSIDFLKKANDLGIDIFYISGRLNSIKSITINHLKSLGFPVKSEQHVLLQEEANQTLSKQDKRNWLIQQNYHPVMLFGDQLSDFSDTTVLTLDSSKEWVREHQDKFGASWFILPNVVYGQWEELVSTGHPPHSINQIHQARVDLSSNLKARFSNIPEAYLQHVMLADIWIQHSANFSATALQTFTLAKDALNKPSNLSKPNKAIVIDIDGTVIQYPPIHLTPPFCHKFESPEDKISDYIRQFDSSTVPGAKDFLDKANELGYEIFYITARDHSSGRPDHDGDIAALTLAQLSANKMPKAQSTNLLNRTSFCPEGMATCDKSYQRAAVQSGRINNTEYDIVLYIGDFLNDFDLTEQGLSPIETSSIAKISNLFGRHYFLIPNPVSKTWMWKYYSKVAGKNVCFLSEDERANLRIKLLEQWPENP